MTPIFTLNPHTMASHYRVSSSKRTTHAGFPLLSDIHPRILADETASCLCLDRSARLMGHLGDQIHARSWPIFFHTERGLAPKKARDMEVRERQRERERKLARRVGTEHTHSTRERERGKQARQPQAAKLMERNAGPKGPHVQRRSRLDCPASQLVLV